MDDAKAAEKSGRIASRINQIDERLRGLSKELEGGGINSGKRKKITAVINTLEKERESLRKELKGYGKVGESAAYGIAAKEVIKENYSGFHMMALGTIFVVVLVFVYLYLGFSLKVNLFSYSRYIKLIGILSFLLIVFLLARSVAKDRARELLTR